MKNIVINLIGAAGSGKSVIANEVFAKVKRMGISCENIQEYAKGVVYEENYKRLKDQLFIFANQLHSMKMAQHSAQVLVVDSPLVLSLYYNKAFGGEEIPDELFEKLIMESYKKFDNLNYFIIRDHEYKQEGRYQKEEEARRQEGEIKALVEKLGIKVKFLKSSDNCAEVIVRDIRERLIFLSKMDKQGEEIERKFLLKKEPYCMNKAAHKDIVQAYIEGGGEREIRVRSINDKKFYLTEKIGRGLSRNENEREISRSEFEEYYANAKRVVWKRRYRYPIGKDKWAEIDFYADEHGGLATVEVEFASEREAKDFIPPDWFGDEITSNDAYKNYKLSVEK